MNYFILFYTQDEINQVNNINNSEFVLSNTQNKIKDFNQDNSGWDVSQVTDMTGMFGYTAKFGQSVVVGMSVK